jgi:SAM-dependent methyltransferase
MTSNPGDGTFLRGAAYDTRFDQLAASGRDMHGEASLVMSLLVARQDGDPPTVLDAGCGTGRVAIELARRGVQVVGVDVDPVMIDRARVKAPELEWHVADLADPAGLPVHRPVDLAVLAGNVMIFLEPGTAGSVIANVAAVLRPGALLIAGFQLEARRLGIDDYDQLCASAGLEPVDRFATWDRAPFPGQLGDYAVSVHRRR